SHLDELAKLGASISFGSAPNGAPGSRSPESNARSLAHISGPTVLHGGEVVARDVRGAAALALAGLVCEGSVVIDGAENVVRGYEDFAERLRSLGADIREEL
ncbi:MAG: hypothetical protein WB565_13210, partial [Acidimicrobiales bacterium]